MADETPTPQAGEGNPDGQTPPAAEPTTFDAEYVRQLRAEAARYRREAQDAKAKNASYEAEKLTEAERLQAQAKAAQEAMQAAVSELRQARAEAAIAKAAAKEGVNPVLLGKLVAVDFDDNGQPVNVETALAQVLKEYPQLKPQPASIAATNPGRVAKLSIEEIKRMTPAEVNARWQEVEAALAAK